MQDPWIAPSILSANFAALGDEVSKVLRAGADLIHVDVMDNHYVPNLTFGPLVCAALREHGIQAPIDVHLMVEPVDSLIEPFAQSGANYISFHPEASKHVDRTLQLIHSFGCKAGVVLNPATSLHVLDHILDKIDLVLIMSVNPGFGGQLFLESSIAKIKKLRHILDSHPRAIRLSVDGGVNQENIGKIFAAGADTFVAGSAIFKANDYKAAITNMRQALK